MNFIKTKFLDSKFRYEDSAQDYYEKNRDFIDKLPQYENIFDVLKAIDKLQQQGHFKYINGSLKNLSRASAIRILFKAKKVNKLQEYQRWASALEYYETFKDYFDNLPRVNTIQELLHLIIKERKNNNFLCLKNIDEFMSLGTVIRSLILPDKAPETFADKLISLNYLDKRRELILEKILEAHIYLKHNNYLNNGFSEKRYKDMLRSYLVKGRFPGLKDPSKPVSRNYFNNIFNIAWEYFKNVIAIINS